MGATTSTLDRYPNRYSSPYAGHYHDFLGASSSNNGSIPLSIPKHNSNNYAFEPSSLYHSHSHGTNESSVSMSHGSSGGMRLNFKNSDDFLLQPSYVESSGTFPHRIRIPSNPSVTSRSSTERVDMRNSPMPIYKIEVSKKINFVTVIANKFKLSNVNLLTVL